MAEESGSGYLHGLLAGVFVGAAAALLLAPKPGGQLRHELAEGASKFKGKAADLGGALNESTHELKAIGEELVSNVRSCGGDALSDAGGKASDLIESMHNAVRDKARAE